MGCRDLAHDFNVVKVSEADIRVHEGQADGFYKVAGQVGGSPRNVMQRQRIRSILGMPVSR
jgi:hypothetical protein